MTHTEDRVEVRPATDEECASFHKNGWVTLRNLISEADAQRLRAEAEQLMAEQIRAREGSGPGAHVDAVFALRDVPSGTSRPFDSLSQSASLGKSAARLMSSPLFGPRKARRWATISGTLLVKRPQSDRGSVTPWHQDRPFLPLDRDGALVVGSRSCRRGRRWARCAS